MSHVIDPKFTEEVGALMKKYGVESLVGLAIRDQRSYSVIEIYNIMDFDMYVVVKGVGSKLKEFLLQQPTARVADKTHGPVNPNKKN